MYVHLTNLFQKNIEIGLSLSTHKTARTTGRGSACCRSSLQISHGHFAGKNPSKRNGTAKNGLCSVHSGLYPFVLQESGASSWEHPRDSFYKGIYQQKKASVICTKTRGRRRWWTLDSIVVVNVCLLQSCSSAPGLGTSTEELLVFYWLLVAGLLSSSMAEATSTW